MGQVISVINEKGGVGKTTLTVMLAYELSARGHKVCVIDNDSSGDATTSLLDEIPAEIALGNSERATGNSVRLYEGRPAEPVEVEKNLHLLGTTDTLSLIKGEDLEPVYQFTDSVEELAANYDYVVIDCPPSFGLVFTAAVFASTYGGVVIPMMPDELAFKAAVKVDTRLKQISKRSHPVPLLGVVLNRIVNNPMPVSAKYYIDEAHGYFGDLIFDARISQAVKVQESMSLNQRLGEFGKNAAVKKSIKQFVAFTDELLERLESLK